MIKLLFLQYRWEQSFSGCRGLWVRKPEKWQVLPYFNTVWWCFATGGGNCKNPVVLAVWKSLCSPSLIVSVFCQLSSEAPVSPSAVSSPSLSTKRFSCRICMESFHGRSSMENHKRAHVDANTFKCPDCDFTSSSWPEVKVSFKLAGSRMIGCCLLFHALMDI